MCIRIELVTENMYPEIHHFEMKNKAFFESILPPRPVTYQQLDTFKTVMASLLSEQQNGLFYMYVIRDEKDAFIGRINLQMIRSENSIKAELGYRVDFNEQGKGYTSQAIKLILKAAFELYKVDEVIAGTSKENIASQRVLEKNGFEKIGEEENVMRVNGEWVDGILYAIRNIE
ncbi:GNAT family N-acetyltransferase [Fusibacter ferrireducens]|uniref:GNAT family N-acetyltransferase n=1 Tax=Fusibacter ferrireducens TaxID=2785058 RepID=A0ABR9ZNC4_9FIRM|nr:GNAT family protein [Fusibacter ferrireducens]MBF4691934.1 GNAT family N-acetyltransferase [Fusibacter ferrireducens]